MIELKDVRDTVAADVITIQRADFARRLAAAAADLACQYLIYLAAAIAAFMVICSSPSGCIAKFPKEVQLVYLLPFVVSSVYYAIEIYSGTSLGKNLFKLRVLGLNGQSASVIALFLRFILKTAILWIGILFCMPPYSRAFGTDPVLVSLLLLAAAIPFIAVLRPCRQTFYDQLSKTAVFRTG